MIRYLFFITILVGNSLFAQQFTKSPLSVNGLGEEDYTGNAIFTSLGNTRVVYIDSTVLNLYNPASYSFLSHGQPIFSTGAYFQNYQFLENGSTIKNNSLAMSHIAFGFSFKNRFGLAFGIRPFTNTGYDLLKSDLINGDSITTQLTGSGNLTYAFTGISFKVLNLEKHKLSFGVNAGNVFGTNLNRQTVYIQNELIGSIKQNTLKISGFTPEYGMNYQFLINKSSNLSLSVLYKNSVKYNEERKVALIAATDFKNENTFDTLNYDFKIGKLKYPTSLEFGIKYDFTKYLNRTSLKIPQLILLASYKSTKWEEYESSIPNIIGFKNTYGYNLGLQFAPHVDFYDRSKNISFFSRVRYRVGYQYELMPYSINDKYLNTTNFSAGFGFPITSQRTLSSVNFAVNYCNRGNGTSTDFNEKNLGFSLGISISPAFYDRWFKKNQIE